MTGRPVSASGTQGIHRDVSPLNHPPVLVMPVAFKEWAVTVRALAEGEQLLTLRKGVLRESSTPFRLAHERFFQIGRAHV